MKTIIVLLASLASTAYANIAPTVVIQSAAMRPGTSLMDVVFRVNDLDNATVKTRALAFVDGVRSFANVIRPVTFVEGTADKLGETIPANVDHTLTWDVAADWNTDLGQIKFEVLAMDERGLLPFDWITIPAAGGKPALKINNNSPSNTEVLDALFWQYASADPGLILTNGLLSATAASGVFHSLRLADSATLGTYAIPYILKSMNLDPAGAGEVAYAESARAGIQLPDQWHAVNRPWAGISPIISWGSIQLAAGATDVTQMDASGNNMLVLNRDGGVVQSGTSGGTKPANLPAVTMVAAGDRHSVVLKADGTVICWGENSSGQSTPPAGLSGVTAIAAGNSFSLALKSDGTVVRWGSTLSGQTTPPASWVDIVAISAGQGFALALKRNGTVVGWGSGSFSSATPPAGLTGVTAIAAGYSNSLALKNDGNVVAWGGNQLGESTLPTGLANVIGIAAGAGSNRSYCLAVLANGSVVGWGENYQNNMTPPAGLAGVTSATVGNGFCAALRPKQL